MREFDSVYIGGRWHSRPEGEIRSVHSPATGEVVGTALFATVDDVDEAITAARSAFPAWAATSLEERIRLLTRLLGLVRAHEEELAGLVSEEMGAPLDYARETHVGVPIAMIENTIDVLRGLRLEEPLGTSLILREPVGVVAAITPWNYPLYQLVAKVIPAIAAGCTTVIKPAELSPLSTYRFTELVDEAGLPAGVYNLVPGEGPVVGEAMATHREADMVSFTGSTKAGSRVAALASQQIKRVALELGGKSASVVLAGAALDTAVRGTVEACMDNGGQSCSAWTRLVVPSDQVEEAARIAGDAAREIEPSLGPVITEQQYDKIQAYITEALEQGATATAGGPGRREDVAAGPYPRATVLRGVTPDMRIAQEEVFGPVLVVLGYDTEDEALAIANGTEYGLHAGVWAVDDETGLRFARGIRAGQVVVNGGDFNVAAPFGGYGKSGVGRELGPFGVDEFFEIKSVQLPGAAR